MLAQNRKANEPRIAKVATRRPVVPTELSKLPREAVCSAVSPRVRGNFGGKFASQGHEDKIKHVCFFFSHRESNSSLCAAIVIIGLSSGNQASNKIHDILT